MNKIEHKSIKFFDKFFPDHKNIDKMKLQITTEGIYSVSGHHATKHISKIIFKIFGTNKITITDATANNGSDTISFALFFDKVNAIELESVNYSVLKHNVKEYDLKNVELYEGSCLDIIPKICKNIVCQDVIFIDAPWMKNYKEYETVSLYLDKIEISDIFMKYEQYCRIMIFKVPTNYNFNKFFSRVINKKFTVVPYYDKRFNLKFHYIICTAK